MDETEFRRRVDQARDLPTLPSAAARIAAIVRDPKSSVADVSTVIEQDPALAAQILRLVNSAFYGFPRTIESITKAVVILGFRKVRDVVLTVQVMEKFGKGGPRGFPFAKLWRHSLTTAIAAEAVARAVRFSPAEDAFLAGLLHDIGKHALATIFPAEFAQVLAALAADPERFPLEVEAEVFGFTHARIGRWLASRWNFPASFAAAIEFHHEPSRARGPVELVGIVHVADILARATGVGAAPWDKVPPLDGPTFQGMHLTAPGLAECYAAMADGVERARDFFDLVREPGA